MYYQIFQTDDIQKAEAWLNEQHLAFRKLYSVNTHGGAADGSLRLILNPAITLVTVPMTAEERINAEF